MNYFGLLGGLCILGNAAVAAVAAPKEKKLEAVIVTGSVSLVTMLAGGALLENSSMKSARDLFKALIKTVK